MTPSFARKKTLEPSAVELGSASSPSGPAWMSFTSTVPAGVPSLFQSSTPVTPSSAVKNSTPFATAKFCGDELPAALVDVLHEHRARRCCRRSGRARRPSTPSSPANRTAPPTAAIEAPIAKPVAEARVQVRHHRGARAVGAPELAARVLVGAQEVEERRPARRRSRTGPRRAHAASCRRSCRRSPRASGRSPMPSFAEKQHHAADGADRERARAGRARGDVADQRRPRRSCRRSSRARCRSRRRRPGRTARPLALLKPCRIRAAARRSGCRAPGVVAGAVPLLFQSSVPFTPSLALKNAVPARSPNGVEESESPVPAVRSFTSTVPAAVPSLFHSSRPIVSSSAGEVGDAARADERARASSGSRPRRRPAAARCRPRCRRWSRARRRLVPVVRAEEQPVADRGEPGAGGDPARGCPAGCPSRASCPRPVPSLRHSSRPAAAVLAVK